MTIINEAYFLGRQYQSGEVSMVDVGVQLTQMQKVLLPENRWSKVCNGEPTENGCYAVVARNKRKKERIIELREWHDGIKMFLPHDDNYIVTHYQPIKFPNEGEHND